MKRFRVKITDKNCFYHEFDDGTAIGGSYGDPHIATLSLNEPEFNALSMFMGQVSEAEALFQFSQCCVLTPWHKRVICKTFPQITKMVTIEIL